MSGLKGLLLAALVIGAAIVTLIVIKPDTVATTDYQGDNEKVSDVKIIATEESSDNTVSLTEQTNTQVVSFTNEKGLVNNTINAMTSKTVELTPKEKYMGITIDMKKEILPLTRKGVDGGLKTQEINNSVIEVDLNNEFTTITVETVNEHGVKYQGHYEPE
jgi:hypothetical protein